MIIPVNFAQVNIVFAGDGVPSGAEVTFGVNLDGGATSLADVADAVQTSYQTRLMSLVNSRVHVSEYMVKAGPSSTGATYILTAHDVGTTDLGALPSSLALLVRKQTAGGGRKSRGRFFWPVLGETLIGDGGIISPTALANLQTGFNGFLADLVTADAAMCLLHADALTAPTPVTALSVQTICATQRRRMRR